MTSETKPEKSSQPEKKDGKHAQQKKKRW